MDLPPPPQGDDPIITQFKPVYGQWELNDDNIKRIDPETGQTILHNYCRHINTAPLEVYRYLIEVKGCDVNVQDKDKDTPLHNALRYFNPNGNINVLMYLLSQKGVNGNTNDLYGCALLHTACENINALPIEIFKLLIETMGCDVNAQNTYNDTPLHYAFRSFDPSWHGDINILYYLLNQKNVDVKIKGQYGCTLLHTACDNIKRLPLEIFRYLTETKGCDINVQDNKKDTPIHRAITCFRSTEDGGNITALTYLLSQNGLSVSIKGQYGCTLLHAVCANINTLSIDVFKLLIEIQCFDVNAQDNNKNTPLYYALRYFDPNKGGDITVLTYLLNKGNANGNIKDQCGYTLLDCACTYINKLPIEIFKLLIETLGYDVNAQDGGNDTPIHRALCCFNPRNGGDISVLQYLFSQTKVHVNIKGKRGDTILHYACEKINYLPLDVYKVLIETMGCDVNVQNNNNDTPLHNAFRCFDPHYGGDITALTYLINQTTVHANINDKRGNTILHMACEKIHDLPLEIFKLLIGTHGADVNIQDNNKDTPLHIAFRSFDPNYDSHLVPVLVYLVDQKNIDVNIKDQNGLTLLHLACICDSLDSKNDDYDDYNDEDSSDDKLNAETDAIFSHILEIIAERCVEQILDEVTP
jgi:ankyrin repeat protein